MRTSGKMLGFRDHGILSYGNTVRPAAAEIGTEVRSNQGLRSSQGAQQIQEMMVIQLLVSLLGLILGSIWLIRRLGNKHDPPLPPGSLGLPLLGETLHLLHAMKKNRVEDFYKNREKCYGSTFKTHIFGQPTVVVQPPSGLKLLFTNHNKLVVTAWPAPIKGAIGDKSLFFMQGDKARSFRQILLAFLGPEASSRYMARTSTIIQKQIEQRCKVGGEIKAYDLVKETLFTLVFALFFSLSDFEEQQELLKPFDKLLQGLLELPVNLPGTKFHKALTARERILAKLDEFIKRRRVEFAEQKVTHDQDLLSVLLTTRGENGELMSDEEIKHNILMLVIAGHDTSSSSLIASIKCIAENPWCFDELKKEHLAIVASKQPGEPLNYSDYRQMKYTWNIAQEAMRVLPPVPGMMRKALVDFELDGYTVPKGWQLLITPARSNMREDFFPEPHKFNPERFNSNLIPYAYAPFGGGPRMCPGYEQAKMQLCVFLHHMIVRFKWSLVDPDETLQMAPMVFPVKGLPIKLAQA